jgi:hypothetical protein
MKYDMKDARDVAHIGQHIREGEAIVGQLEVTKTKKEEFPID